MKKNTLLAAIFATSAMFATVASAGTPEGVINESSNVLRVEISGGMMGEDIVRTFNEDDMQGLVFGQLADARQVDLKETFCVADIPVKTITVTDEFGNETLYRSSEQNCWDENEEDARFGDFAPRYLDYKDMNMFLSALGLPVVDID